MFEGKGCDLGFALGNRRLKRVKRRGAPGVQGLADVGFNVQLSGILGSFSTQVEVASTLPALVCEKGLRTYPHEVPCPIGHL